MSYTVLGVMAIQFDFLICHPYIYPYAFWTSPCGKKCCGSSKGTLWQINVWQRDSRRPRFARCCHQPKYLTCSPEPASRSWRRRCQPGTGRGTRSPRARACRCWGTGRSGTGRTCPRAPSGPAADGGAWSPRTARSSPAPRWGTPGRELFSQQEPKHIRALTGVARAF